MTPDNTWNTGRHDPKIRRMIEHMRDENTGSQVYKESDSAVLCSASFMTISRHPDSALSVPFAPHSTPDFLAQFTSLNFTLKLKMRSVFRPGKFSNCTWRAALHSILYFTPFFPGVQGYRELQNLETYSIFIHICFFYEIRKTIFCTWIEIIGLLIGASSMIMLQTATWTIIL